MRHPGITLLLIATLAFGGVSDARNANAAPSKASLATRAFDRGQKHYEARDFRKALQAFMAALALKRDAAYLFNIAQCHRMLDHLKEAVFYYGLYLNEAPRAANRAQVQTTIAKLKVRLQKRRTRVGHLSVTSSPADAEIHLNGLDKPAVGHTPKMLDLAAGEYLVILRLKGHRAVSRRVRLEAGKTSEVRIALPRITSRNKPLAAPPKPPLPSFHRTWWFWSGVAVTLALAAGSTATGILAVNLHDAWVERHDAADRDVGVKLRTATDVQWGLAAAAALALTIGTALYQRARKKRERSALVLPACSSVGCGVWVRWRY